MLGLWASPTARGQLPQLFYTAVGVRVWGLQCAAARGPAGAARARDTHMAHTGTPTEETNGTNENRSTALIYAYISQYYSRVHTHAIMLGPHAGHKPQLTLIVRGSVPAPSPLCTEQCLCSPFLDHMENEPRERPPQVKMTA